VIVVTMTDRDRQIMSWHLSPRRAVKPRLPSPYLR
jgi:hypothetical protein